MEEPLFSIRMRASLKGKHLAGAERLVDASAISEVTAELVARAVNCTDASADEVHCSLEKIDTTVLSEQLPDISTFRVDDWASGRRLACRLLVDAGVSEEVARRAIRLLADGAAPGGHVMRGAVIMNASSGERLELNESRGVRASRMDLALGSRKAIEHQLAAHGLDHYRVCEALVLAGKVLHAPGIVAELCWSDAPDYVTGYVSSPLNGYQRISALKPFGDRLGGRVFFVTPATELSALTDFLERQPLLFNSLGKISPPQIWNDDE